MGVVAIARFGVLAVATAVAACVSHPDDEAPAAPVAAAAASEELPPPDVPAEPTLAPPTDDREGEAAADVGDGAPDDAPDDEGETDGDDDDDTDGDDDEAAAGEDDLESEDEPAIEGDVAAADIVLDPGGATSIDELVPPLPHRKWLRHRRAHRERLVQIAYRYGVELEDLREWNEIPEDTINVKRGARLRVKAARRPPPREKTTYQVVEGDTWWRVALRHGVDDRDLRAYNWPYKGKMTPGKEINVWIDPIVHEWITSGPDPVQMEEDGGVRRGGIGIGPTDDGRLVHGVRIPAAKPYRLRLPKSAYGTTHAVTELVRAFAIFEAQSDYDRRVDIGAMSRSHGGEIGTHRSHQTGRDVDVRLPRRKGISRFAALTPKRVDWVAAWELVQAFAETDAMVIFLDYDRQRRLYRAAKKAGAAPERLQALIQYPRGRRAARGLVRHSDGHVRHMHVRFGCGAYETECVP